MVTVVFLIFHPWMKFSYSSWTKLNNVAFPSAVAFSQQAYHLAGSSWEGSTSPPELLLSSPKVAWEMGGGGGGGETRSSVESVVTWCLHNVSCLSGNKVEVMSQFFPAICKILSWCRLTVLYFTKFFQLCIAASKPLKGYPGGNTSFKPFCICYV